MPYHAGQTGEWIDDMAANLRKAEKNWKLTESDEMYGVPWTGYVARSGNAFGSGSVDDPARREAMRGAEQYRGYRLASGLLGAPTRTGPVQKPGGVALGSGTRPTARGSIDSANTGLLKTESGLIYDENYWTDERLAANFGAPGTTVRDMHETYPGVLRDIIAAQGRAELTPEDEDYGVPPSGRLSTQRRRANTLLG